MADVGDLLAQLTAAVARTASGDSLSARLCEAYRELAAPPRQRSRSGTATRTG